MLAILPDRERKIVVLRFFDGLTQSEIADRIGMSQMHVSRLLKRSLEVLRSGLAREHDDLHRVPRGRSQREWR